MNVAGFAQNLAFAAIIVVIGVYGRLMKSLIGRIESVHPATWDALGRPTMQLPRPREIPEFLAASWRMLAFAFSSRHRRLEDPQLTTSVWSVRALAVIGALLLLTIAAVDPDAPWAALHR